MRVYSLVQEYLYLIGQETAEKGEDEHSWFNQILRIRAVHFLAFFILVYVGGEVTIGGMVIHRSSSQRLICRIKVGLSHLCSTCVAGVTSSGLFGCVFPIGRRTVFRRVQVLWLVGRILLFWINRKISCCDYQAFLILLSLISQVGERRVLLIYSLLAIE